MAEEGRKQSATDPFQMWRDWLTQCEHQMNRVFNEAMSTDAFGQSSGRMMEAFLTFQRSMNQVTETYFNLLNVPTRTDVLSLGERLTAIEERLGGLEQSMQAIAHASAPEAAETTELQRSSPRPRRTRQPSSKRQSKTTSTKSQP